MLGTWKTIPVELKFNDDAMPVYSQRYPVLRVYKTMFKKKFKILVKLGILKEANDSGRGAHYFAQPEAKTNCVRFLSKIQNLNR